MRCLEKAVPPEFGVIGPLIKTCMTQNMSINRLRRRDTYCKHRTHSIIDLWTNSSMLWEAKKDKCGPAGQRYLEQQGPKCGIPV